MHKKYRIILIIELIVLMLAIANFFVPLRNYSYVGEDFYSEEGICLQSLFDIPEKGYYLDNELAEGEEDNWTIFSPKTNLRLGSYQIILKYLSEDVHNSYSCVADYNSWYVIAGRTKESLGASSDRQGMTKELSVRLPFNTNGYQVVFNYSGNGYIYVYGMEIKETMWWKWVILLSVLAVMSCTVGMFYMSLNCQKKTRTVAIVLLLLAIAASLPYMGVYIFDAHDLKYHLARIEALKTALIDHQIPVRISSYWMRGKGYASSIFYGDIFLLPSAILRIMGASIAEAYKAFVFAVNIATCLTIYWCAKKLFGGRELCLTVAAAYVLSPYRLLCIYSRGAVGEYLALTFYPLVLGGIYLIYSEDFHKKESILSGIKLVLPFSIGFCGILLSHIISTIIAILFCVLFILLNIRDTIKNGIWRNLLWAGGICLALTLWFWVPFLQMYGNGIQTGLIQSEYSDLLIGKHGAFLWQLFNPFPHGGWANAVHESLGHKQGEEMSITVGPLILPLFVFMLIKLEGYRNRDNFSAIANQVSRLGALALFMATIIFPWDFLQQTSKLLNLIIGNIQFPWRFLGIASLFLSILVGTVIANIYKTTESGLVKHLLCGIFSVLVFWTAFFYISERCDEANWNYWMDDIEYLSDTIGNAEYLPEGTPEKDLIEMNGTYGDEEISVSSFYRDRGRSYIELANTSEVEKHISVPVLYYSGYHSEDVFTGDSFDISRDDNSLVKICIPGKYSGTVCVFYKEPFLWRICEVISFLSFWGIALVIIWDFKGRILNKYEGKCYEK